MASLTPYVAVVVACGAYLALRIAVRAWERHRLGDFGRILDPENQVWLDELRRQVEENNLTVGRLSSAARTQWGVDRAAALRSLERTCQILESVVQPNLAEMLSVLRRIANTLSVIAPPRPLAVAAFRLWRVRGFAGLSEFLRWLLLTGRDRARIRLWFLRRALLVIVRTVLGTAVLAGRHGTWYATIDDAVADLETTQHELLVTAEAVLLALEAWRADHTPAATPKPTP